MSNKKKIEIALKKLILENESEFVAMLSGEWGIGKTYFWNELKDKHLKEKKVVYISLFGLNSLDEIKNEVIFTLSKYTKSLNKYRDKIQGMKGGSLKGDDMGLSIGGAVINATLSLFSTTDFKDIVICFDDFERLSDSVALKDVMGLISQFKEQKKCKIIMILNEEELDKLADIDGKKHNKIFALYKEKIIDYNFYYKPSFDDLFSIVKEDIEYFKTEWFEGFFQTISLHNLRIMKQIIFQLNYFKFIEAYHLDDKVLKEFVDITLNIFIFYAKSNYSYQQLLELQEYLRNKLIQDEDKLDKVDEYEEKSLFYTYFEYSENKEAIEAIIYEFIENYTFEEERLKLLLTQNNLNLEYYIVKDNLRVLGDKIQLDFQCSLVKCSNEIYSILCKYKEEIIAILSIDNFHFYMSLIKEHIEIEENFENNIIKEYIKKQPERRRIHFNTYEHFITKYYSSLIPYLKEQNTHNLMKDIDIKKVSELLDKVDSGWNPSDCFILNNLDSVKYKNYIIESSDFFYTVIEFILRHNTTQDFAQSVKAIKKVLLELRSQNKDYAWKIDRIIKHKNIKLDEECID